MIQRSITLVVLVTLLMTMAEATAAPSALHRVPSVPSEIEGTKGLSGLLTFWKSCLRDTERLSKAETQVSGNSAGVQLVITPKTQLLANLAPQGSSRHPLYLDTPDSRLLKVDLVLDSLSEESMSPALLQPNGQQTIENLNNKTLKLKTDENGALTVNDVPGDVVDQSPGGMTVIAVNDFLFDHRQRIEHIRATKSPH